MVGSLTTSKTPRTVILPREPALIPNLAMPTSFPTTTIEPAGTSTSGTKSTVVPSATWIAPMFMICALLLTVSHHWLRRTRTKESVAAASFTTLPSIWCQHRQLLRLRLRRRRLWCQLRTRQPEQGLWECQRHLPQRWSRASPLDVAFGNATRSPWITIDPTATSAVGVKSTALPS